MATVLEFPKSPEPSTSLQRCCPSCIDQVLLQVASPHGRLHLLIRGPSGSGKTTVARLVHDNGARRDRTFIVVSFANLPGPLFESELFGAARGAHSTASQRVPGKATSEGGTLSPDEVAELTLEAQAKLLQFIEALALERHGEKKRWSQPYPGPVDV